MDNLTCKFFYCLVLNRSERELTSAIEAPVRSGSEAMTTIAIRQLRMKAMTNAVTVRAMFCTIVDNRSARALLTNEASAARIEVSKPVLFSSKSNQPTSLESIATVGNKHNSIQNHYKELNFPLLSFENVPENMSNRTRDVSFSPISV